jgi:hypothetical protein
MLFTVILDESLLISLVHGSSSCLTVVAVMIINLILSTLLNIRGVLYHLRLIRGTLLLLLHVSEYIV